MGNEPRRTGFDAGDLTGVAEMNFRGGSEQAGGYGMCQVPIELESGVGHAGVALHFKRKQRVGRA